MVRTNNWFIVDNPIMAAGGNQATTTIDDNSSSYYFHSGDHPGLMLISTLLNGSNYNS